MVVLTVDLHPAVVDDRHLFFTVFFQRDDFFRLVNASDQLQSDLILKIDGEMGQKEDSLLDDLHVSLQHKLFFQLLIDSLQKFLLFIILQRRLILLNFFLYYIFLHLIA